MDLSLRLRECLIRASVYREEAGLAGLEAGMGEGGGTLGSRGGVCLQWNVMKQELHIKIQLCVTSLE